MSVVKASIHIHAAPDRVWAAIMDPSRLHEWVTIHRKLKRADQGPVRVGFQMDQQIHLRGVNLEVHWRLASCEVARRAVWTGSGPARSKASIEYALRAEEGGKSTCFDYTNEFHPPFGPLGAIASRALVGGIPEREAKLTLQRLRELLEET